MAVIALPNISPRVSSPDRAAVTWGKEDITAINRSPLAAATTTLERPGARQTCTLVYENLYVAERAQLEAFLYACRGMANRFYVPDYSRLSLRGSFPNTELLTNNFFASGTTGWSATAEHSISVSDSVLRVRRAQVTAAASISGTAVTVTQYAPYAMRALIGAGQGSYQIQSALTDAVDGTVTSPTITGNGLATAKYVMNGTGSTPLVRDAIASGILAGNYFLVPYTSYSRCALVDNGTNSLLRSDEFGNAVWVQTGLNSVSSDVVTAPDGSGTADALVESNANSAHQVAQSVTVSASALDYAFTVAIARSSRTWCAIGVRETTGPSNMTVFVNLSTGALGTIQTGANWSNVRAFVTDLGNTWYQITIVGRKTNAATTLTAVINAATADTVASYLGTSALTPIVMWRATLAQSSVPTKLTQTVAAASSGTSQTGGALTLKGLPVSTSGLLLPGDPFEFITSVGSEFKRATAPLNSDASGMGHLMFESPIRNSPADGAAVIFQRPLMRSMLDSNSIRWTEKLGGFCDLEFTAAEDLAA